jgi:mannose/fructose/N-acetylgalactosamine-specific phosphotransferase system component IIB
MITIARIDERLIHGQVAYAWSVAYKSEGIMVIDNEVAKDIFQVSLLQMACPKGVKCIICDEEKAAELLKKYEKRKLFVVVKHPSALLSICEKGIELKEINVGGLYYKEGRRQLSKTVYVDAEMESVFRKLSEMGIKLENRTTPTDTKEDLMELL